MGRDQWLRDELGLRAGEALRWENDPALSAYSAVVTRAYFAGHFGPGTMRTESPRGSGEREAP